MRIQVERPEEDRLSGMGVRTWPIWTCEPSEFEWSYSERETCYILEGLVTVETDEGAVSFGPGDLVVFPEGLNCVWRVHSAVRKHYRFG